MWCFGLLLAFYCETPVVQSAGCTHLVKPYTIVQQKALAAQLRAAKATSPDLAQAIVDYKAMRDACRK